MSLRKNKNSRNSNGNVNPVKDVNSIQRVVDIILNSNHPQYVNENSIGIIFFSDVESGEYSENMAGLRTAKPINKNNFTYPLKGELVQVTIANSNEHYSQLGGDPSSTTNYYTQAINVHNNAGSNALPLKRFYRKNNKRETEPISDFNFQSEFVSPSREVAAKKLEDYLRTLGYTSGRSDRRAPNYNLFQKANGDYVFRLEDSKENDQKLGDYFKENRQLRSLKPSEGDTIMEGKSGQRVRFTITGPDGTNAVSRNVTDDPTDGNPNVGDKAMLISLGNDQQENITADAASVYLLENQSIPIDVSSTNIDSLKSEYTPIEDPLESIQNIPVKPIPNPLPDNELVINEESFETIQADTSDNNPSPPPSIAEEELGFSDPVFEALDVAIDEGILNVITPEGYELDAQPIKETPPEDLLLAEAEGDPAIVLNPNKFGYFYPGKNKKIGPEFDERMSPSYKKYLFDVHDDSTTKEDIMEHITSGSLVMIGDANVEPNKYSAYMESGQILDNKYYLHKTCAPAFISWIQEMDQKNVNWMLTSALRFGPRTGGGPHGLGLAVDFGNLHRELEKYDIKGSKLPKANKELRINSQTYKDIALIGAKHGWYNPWRLSDVGGEDEVWHFEYWGEPLA